MGPDFFFGFVGHLLKADPWVILSRSCLPALLAHISGSRTMTCLTPNSRMINRVCVRERKYQDTQKVEGRGLAKRHVKETKEVNSRIGRRENKGWIVRGGRIQQLSQYQFSSHCKHTPDSPRALSSIQMSYRKVYMIAWLITTERDRFHGAGFRRRVRYPVEDTVVQFYLLSSKRYTLRPLLPFPEQPSCPLNSVFPRSVPSSC